MEAVLVAGSIVCGLFLRLLLIPVGRNDGGLSGGERVRGGWCRRGGVASVQWVLRVLEIDVWKCEFERGYYGAYDWLAMESRRRWSVREADMHHQLEDY